MLTYFHFSDACPEIFMWGGGEGNRILDFYAFPFLRWDGQTPKMNENMLFYTNNINIITVRL